MPADPGRPDNVVEAMVEVSDRMGTLVREEIQLARAEITQKATSIGRGAIAVGAGAVFGVFALIFALEALAWGFNDIFVNGAGELWIGFTIVFGILAILATFAFLFAWRKLRVGPPAPTMAIEEAKRIRDTVSTGQPGEDVTISAGGEG